jgi:hypothetical protein
MCTITITITITIIIIIIIIITIVESSDRGPTHAVDGMLDTVASMYYPEKYTEAPEGEYDVGLDALEILLSKMRKPDVLVSHPFVILFGPFLSLG